MSNTISTKRVERSPRIRFGTNYNNIDEIAFNKALQEGLDEWQRCLVMICSFAGLISTTMLDSGVHIHLEAPNRKTYQQLIIELIPIFIEFHKTLPLTRMTLSCIEFRPGRKGKFKIQHETLVDKDSDLKMLLTRYDGYPWLTQIDKLTKLDSLL
jgi:hypothetical protein